MESMEKTSKKDQMLELPPGFRFHPTDEELINNYLIKKVIDPQFYALAIVDVDLNKHEPWDLPGFAKMGEKEWYFFCVRDRKYSIGQRTNRATNVGYWKATGKDKVISTRNTIIGMKKTLVFYKGRAPKGEKTEWIMHEYRLEGNQLENNLPHLERSEWVICRVFEKSHSVKKMHKPNFVRLFLDKEPLPKDACQMPLFMDSSMHTNETRTSPNELSEMTCISNMNKVNDQNNTRDNMVDLTKTPISNVSSILGSSYISPTLLGIAGKIPTTSYFQSNQIAQQIGISQCPTNDFVLGKPPMLMTLIENNGSNAMQNQKAESSQVTNSITPMTYDNDMFYGFVGEEHSSASTGFVDIGNLWNF